MGGSERRGGHQRVHSSRRQSGRIAAALPLTVSEVKRDPNSGFPEFLGYGGQVVLDHDDGHDVEDAAGIGILRVGQLFVTPACVVSALNLAVDLPAISDVQIDTIFAVGSNCIVDDRVSRLFLSYLLDVEGFFVAYVEGGTNLGDHVLHRYFPGRWS